MSSHHCSICGKPVDPDEITAAPFCSQRCRQIDLNRWLDEQYGLPYESEDSCERQQPEDLEE